MIPASLEWDLHALLDLPRPTVPPELLQFLASRKNLDVVNKQHLCEQELHARLYFYELILKKDVSALPPEVEEELRENFRACLALLLHVQMLLGARGAAAGTVGRIVDGEIESLGEPLRLFVGEQIAHLVQDSSYPPLLRLVQDARDQLGLQSNFDRVVALAILMRDFDPRQQQATIFGLQELAKVDDEAGVAGLYLLAGIYKDLALPYEEKDCYSKWMMGLAKVYKRAPAELAAAVCKSNRGFERTIIDGARRFVDLLKAGESKTEHTQVVTDFMRSGYKEQFQPLLGDQGRQPGHQCEIIAREDVHNNQRIKGLISNILIAGSRREACLILRDDTGAEVEKFPRAPEIALDREILARLPNHLAGAGLAILQEIIDEGMMGSRKWVVCHDQTRPMDGLAIGILTMEAEFSVVFARAILFETRLDEAKDKAWFEGTVRLLNQQFDPQKLDLIKQGVRRVAEQVSTGQIDVEVVQL